MKNKIILSIVGLLLVGLDIIISITNYKRSQIAEVRKDLSQVTKQQKHLMTPIDNLQTNYNANDTRAKSKLLESTTLLAANQIMISN
ncbi:hypothetical protein [Leuconostoc suionicum]|uniref:hypothetical protein n=1 Tax=Leuconostoc suionicum TaxID=1511761 RepID=UPI003D7F56ED